MNLTINGTTVQVTSTKAGGRVVATTDGAKSFRRYTHPSRAKTAARLINDICAVSDAANGLKPKFKVANRG